ncbi:MAG: 3-hydroxyacyl-CoA dehydrogenase/enoyl-CoA hydratase family protein [Bacteroidetes bacterium]|jgi:3-hydroxyacyl-CoA dehydrogenase|nr:3-hydroxyacyl-CoA dehydrogenase/enoyl-CoA hydratase family protein [Bacteroidota bacterium]
METPTIDTRSLDLAAPKTTKPFRTATVLGAGTMGAQIAAHLANAGLQVYLLDVTPEAIGKDGAPNDIVERSWKRTTKLKPNPLFTDDVKHRVTLGNFDEHFHRVGEADWVIEAVVERLDIKRDVMARVEEAAREDAVISTNTSGIPIREIAEGRSDAFKRRFLGTHFFNPPRYLKLLELIPTDVTDAAVLERVAQFGRIHLGKGIVVANDVPYFVGNRVGTYGMFRGMRYFTDGDYSIEEVDTLTGPLVGRPKSATFRTADVVGLDVMTDVAKNLYEKAEHDESRDAFLIPDLLKELVDNGQLGAKSGAGFYKKEGKVIKSIDPDTMEYTEPGEQDLGDLNKIKQAGDLAARLNALFEDDGRAGAFFRETTLDLLGYSARRIPEITDSPANVDKAIRWGFGWEMGPFETWDALGFERVIAAMQERDIALPDWVHTMRSAGSTRFYQDGQVYVPTKGGYVADPVPEDELRLDAVKAEASNELWSNEDAALLDLGDGVALYEFRSKSNSLGTYVMQGLREVLDRVENDPDLRGLVIGNEGKNFSVGANLGEVAMAIGSGQWDQLETFLKGFQDTIQAVRYSTKPVVVAVHQRVLGGGCEMVMASPNPVASAESYIGLPELGVGLIPAGTGTTRMAAKAATQTPNDNVSELQPWVRKYFEQIAMATVATSGREAQALGFLPDHARIVMNDNRRLHVAKQEVLRLSEEGYLPPPAQNRIHVLGAPGRAAMEVGLYNYLQGGYISEYDHFLAQKLAYVITGGDLTSDDYVPEDYLLELEREVFLSLLGEQKTRDRIMHILEHNKPLRN